MLPLHKIKIEDFSNALNTRLLLGDSRMATKALYRKKGESIKNYLFKTLFPPSLQKENKYISQYTEWFKTLGIHENDK